MKTLHKSENKMIAGVCGGVAEYFNIDPTIVRLAFAACVLIGGTGVMAYIIAAIIMPEAEQASASVNASAGKAPIGE
ncbi:MAG: PspC domain-containing protein [Clostridia bacterium]|nr:PspC domain-containing protein [Clostridia bacterium]